MTTSSRVVLTEGFIVCGKWNKRSYRIVRLLGEGANGKVFLVHSGKQAYALKFGFDALDLQMEVNVLRELDKKKSRPFLHDADDVELNGSVYPFYVMTYIRGDIPRHYIGRNGPDWFYMIGLNLLRKLQALHLQGYAFGDLKAENVLVSGYGDVELVDYGGVTERGRSIKQFTELYDRGYWNAGERVADDGYDLFGFAVLCLQMSGMEKRMKELASGLPQNRSSNDLVKLIEECPNCRPVAHVLKNAIAGRWTSSSEAAASWKQVMEKHGASRHHIRSAMAAVWIKTAFFTSIGLFLSVLYMFWFNG
ncbi:serine/threonine protein kinase [Paenibacillus mesophilus]|uniref:protein kinase domain-containing protein n=1 Tax=Paenibacillus mesophilus TaxID=2582849 RepID=UPI00110DC1D7|nr:serine/threonine-protein kinase [Paenibacillus mesophilus]TMV44290.1 serine/threonine protein kinase [Paenibacillus mesophilus]